MQTTLLINTRQLFALRPNPKPRCEFAAAAPRIFTVIRQQNKTVRCWISSDYNGIMDYEPTELVITARAGTRLADLEAELDRHGQMLAFEPPHFGAAATLGGCIAAGLSGPRRVAAGSARDFVLGVRMLDGKGEDLHFGGQVMKNVAGYDVSRLMAGSMGTLGVLLEVSLKVLPKPAIETTLCMCHA
jgi:glycolate oxidase FAD binding subunit